MRQYCWLWHDWGNWVGVEYQPIMIRRCMHCFASDVKVDEAKKEYLKHNTISFEDYLKELETKCKD